MIKEQTIKSKIELKMMEKKSDGAISMMAMYDLVMNKQREKEMELHRKYGE